MDSKPKPKPTSTNANERGNKSIKTRNNSDDSDYMYSSDSSCDSDYSNLVEMIEVKKKGSTKSKNAKFNNRLPTRRPDPNVSNRNALMARENRRKKKEYVEMLEKDIQKQCEINKRLCKMIKRQKEYLQKLKNEKNYFKSALSNNTELLSLVNLLRSVPIAIKQKSESEKVSINDSSSLQIQSSNLSSSQTECVFSNESSTQSSNLSSQSETSLISTSNDNNCRYNEYNNSLMNDYDTLNDFNQESDTDYFDFMNSFENNSDYSIIHDEHSYYNTSPKQPITEDELSDSGICLHISDGKMSLELCAACHENSKKPVIKEF